MRHYMPTKSNPYALPHNVYMQMLYLIRDYDARHGQGSASGERRWQWHGVAKTEQHLKEEYEKRPEQFGALKPLQAFFDYAYFSLMFTKSQKGMGAGKRSWNLYRCKFAYLVATNLGLISVSESHPDG